MTPAEESPPFANVLPDVDLPFADEALLLLSMQDEYVNSIANNTWAVIVVKPTEPQILIGKANLVTGGFLEYWKRNIKLMMMMLTSCAQAKVLGLAYTDNFYLCNCLIHEPLRRPDMIRRSYTIRTQLKKHATEYFVREPNSLVAATILCLFMCPAFVNNFLLHMFCLWNIKLLWNCCTKKLKVACGL